jgi:hypothetical protein
MYQYFKSTFRILRIGLERYPADGHVSAWFAEREESIGSVEFNFLIPKSAGTTNASRLFLIDRLRVYLQLLRIRHEHLLYRSKEALIKYVVNQNNPFTALEYK